MSKQHILVLGGTRFFGIHLVQKLLEDGHDVTIATRGRQQDPFGGHVRRMIVERTDGASLREALRGETFDTTFDSIAYSSLDVRALLEHLKTGRYVMTSTGSVYDPMVMDMPESAFDPHTYPLSWRAYDAEAYGECKRQAECALFQAFPDVSAVAVRFPFVVGPDDYTRRLYFYVEAAIRQRSLHIGNLDAAICAVDSHDAGRFLAWLGTQSNYIGPINGAGGTFTLRSVLEHVRQATGKAPLLHQKDGETGPYEGCPSFSLSTALAASLGYDFTPVSEWLPETLDAYIKRI